MRVPASTSRPVIRRSRVFLQPRSAVGLKQAPGERQPIRGLPHRLHAARGIDQDQPVLHRADPPDRRTGEGQHQSEQGEESCYARKHEA